MPQSFGGRFVPPSHQQPQEAIQKLGVLHSGGIGEPIASTTHIAGPQQNPLQLVQLLNTEAVLPPQSGAYFQEDLVTNPCGRDLGAKPTAFQQLRVTQEDGIEKKVIVDTRSSKQLE